VPSDSTSAHPPGPRVVIRFRLPVPDPATGATLSDVVGDLVAATAEEIVVDSRHGRVTVPRSTVVATRVVPPRPSRRGAPHRALSVDDLERVMVGAWPPVERAALGRWLLRAAHGFTSRANSALVVGSPDRPVPEALTAVRQWYASRTLSARLAVPMPMGLDLAADPVAAAAIEAGWEPGDRVTVLTGFLRQYGLTQRSVITCFDADITAYAHQTYAVKTQGFPASYLRNFTEDTYSHYYSVGIEMRDLSRELCDFFRSRNIDPWRYCPDDDAGVYKMIESGATLATCNNPIPALRILKEKKLRR